MADAVSGAQGHPYDADYYAHGCGPRPYARDPVWLGFFGDVADRIVADIGPRSVLDAGCAMGLLVECLRDRGVDASGIDISEYAVGQASDAARPHCRVGSVLEPLDGPYDLVACIEVVEHLDAAEGDVAIANLCAATDDILFSSTPDDHTEPTHQNVQEPEYWAASFARHGFVRDAAFDASFLTPWAARFRRTGEPLAAGLVPAIVGYERRVWQLARANAAQRDALAEQGAEARALLARAEAAEADAARSDAEADALRAEVATWRERWAILDRSWVGAIMRAAERVRRRR